MFERLEVLVHTEVMVTGYHDIDFIQDKVISTEVSDTCSSTFSVALILSLWPAAPPGRWCTAHFFSSDNVQRGLGAYIFGFHTSNKYPSICILVFVSQW